MSKYEAGFLGAGNMGGALAAAAARLVTGERVAVSCSTPAHSAAAAERLGCRAAAPEEILREKSGLALKFCHPSRFLVTAETKEDAIEACRRALRAAGRPVSAQ